MLLSHKLILLTIVLQIVLIQGTWTRVLQNLELQSAIKECDLCLYRLDSLDEGEFQNYYPDSALVNTPVVFDQEIEMSECRDCAELLLDRLHMHGSYKGEGSYFGKRVSLGIVNSVAVIGISGWTDLKIVKSAFTSKVLVALNSRDAKNYEMKNEKVLDWIGQKPAELISSEEEIGKSSEDKLILEASRLIKNTGAKPTLTMYTVAAPGLYASDFIGELASVGWKIQIVYSYQDLDQWKEYVASKASDYNDINAADIGNIESPQSLKELVKRSVLKSFGDKENSPNDIPDILHKMNDLKQEKEESPKSNEIVNDNYGGNAAPSEDFNTDNETEIADADEYDSSFSTESNVSDETSSVEKEKEEFPDFKRLSNIISKLTKGMKNTDVIAKQEEISLIPSPPESTTSIESGNSKPETFGSEILDAQASQMK